MSYHYRLVLFLIASSCLVIGCLSWLVFDDREGITDEPRSVTQDSPRQPRELEGTKPLFVSEGGSISRVEASSRSDSEVKERPIHEFQNQTQAGAISGTLQAESLPVAGALLELLVGSEATQAERLESSGIHSLSDEVGNFILRDLSPQRRYHLKISHVDWAQKLVGPIDIVAGELTSLLPIVLQPATSVSGRVTGRSGVSLTRALVSVFDREATSESVSIDSTKPWKTVLTDEDGHFQFPSLPFSDFEIHVQAEGYATQGRRVRSVLARVPSHRFDFELGPAQGLGGWVRDVRGEPLSHATIRVVPLNHSSGIASIQETDPQGKFQFSDLVDGYHQLEVQKKGYRSISQVVVQSGSHDHVLELAQLEGVAGRVLDSRTGEPVQEFDLFVQNQNQRVVLRAPSTKRIKRPSGEFRIEGLLPGKYVIVVTAKGFAAAYSKTFEIGGGTFLEDVNVYCEPGGSIVGVIAGENEQGLQDTTVLVSRDGVPMNLATEALGGFVRDMTVPSDLIRTDEHGRFEIGGLQSGRYQIRATHPQYSGAMVRSIEVEAGQQTSLAMLTLQTGGSISGVAYDASGTPLANAKIMASCRGGRAKSVLTDEAGNYSIQHLSPADYKLAIRDWSVAGEPLHPFVKAALTKKSSHVVSVREGGETRMDLRLPSDRE